MGNLSSQRSQPRSSIPLPHRLQVYTMSPAPSAAASAPVVGGSNTMITSYVTVSDTIWTTVTAPGAVATGSSPVAAGWSYSGCFADSRDRVMTGIKLANIGNHQVTNTKCVAYCESRGFSMAVLNMVDNASAPTLFLP